MSETIDQDLLDAYVSTHPDLYPPKTKKRFYILIRYKYNDDQLCFIMPTKEHAKKVLAEMVEFSQDTDGAGCGHLYYFAYGLSAQDRVVISLLDILSVTIVNETPDRAPLA